MTNCPFCSDVLLRHVRAGRAYWLCRRCRLEILGTDHPEIKDRSLLKAAIESNPEKAGCLPEPTAQENHETLAQVAHS